MTFRFLGAQLPVERLQAFRGADVHPLSREYSIVMARTS